jgi:nucleoside-diphosphate-sugar epimerase
MSKNKILVTGAAGQIGSVLSKRLIEIYGIDNVIQTDIRVPEGGEGIWKVLDITNLERYGQLIDKYQITNIYHLAALLSASGEKNPQFTWNINLTSYLSLLELLRTKKIESLFYPSTIAAFGENTPQVNTPQFTVMEPTTMYGITKATGELLNQYYFNKYNIDIRSVRYPGIIGWQSKPGGGTTDYAVDIYYAAKKKELFNCFLGQDTTLPMMYMDDAINATIDLMHAPIESIKIRTSYNIAGVSFSPKEIYESILKYIPDFKIEYNPDFRQRIAETWPQSLDDSHARTDWGWSNKYNLDEMTKDMLDHIK